MKKIKLLSFLCVFALLFSLFAFYAIAADEPIYSLTVPEDFTAYEGNGEKMSAWTNENGDQIRVLTQENIYAWTFEYETKLGTSKHSLGQENEDGRLIAQNFNGDCAVKSYFEDSGNYPCRIVEATYFSAADGTMSENYSYVFVTAKYEIRLDLFKNGGEMTDELLAVKDNFVLRDKICKTDEDFLKDSFAQYETFEEYTAAGGSLDFENWEDYYTDYYGNEYGDYDDYDSSAVEQELFEAINEFFGGALNGFDFDSVRLVLDIFSYSTSLIGKIPFIIVLFYYFNKKKKEEAIFNEFAYRILTYGNVAKETVKEVQENEEA